MNNAAPATISHLYNDTKDNGMRFVKVLTNASRDVFGNQLFRSNGMVFRLGENTDVEEWNSTVGEKGGIHFTLANGLSKWWHLGGYIAEISVINGTDKIASDLSKGILKAHKIFITKIWTRNDYICAMEREVFLNNTCTETGHALYAFPSVGWPIATVEIAEKFFEYKAPLQPDVGFSPEVVGALCKKYPSIIAHLWKVSYETYVAFYEQHREHDEYFRLTHIKENAAHYKRYNFPKNAPK